MNTHLLSNLLLVMSLLATSCVHSPLHMGGTIEEELELYGRPPGASNIARPRAAQVQPRVDQELLEAATKGNIEAVVSALDRGADIEAQDRYERTALLLAAGQGHQDVVSRLLERGADIEAKTQHDQNALHFAVMGRHQEVVSTLLEHGADITVQDSEHKTALDYATENGHQEVETMLNDHLSLLANRELQALEGLEWLESSKVPKEVLQLIVNMSYGEGVVE